MKKIEEFLGVGKENAIQRDVLCNLAGLSDDRALRRSLEVARRERGMIIIPDGGGGYYLADISTADGREEAKIFIRKFAHAGAASMNTAKRMLKTINKIEEEENKQFSFLL